LLPVPSVDQHPLSVVHERLLEPVGLDVLGQRVHLFLAHHGEHRRDRVNALLIHYHWVILTDIGPLV
jgi:hypothetical protein